MNRFQLTISLHPCGLLRHGLDKVRRISGTTRSKGHYNGGVSTFKMLRSESSNAYPFSVPRTESYVSYFYNFVGFQFLNKIKYREGAEERHT